MIKSIAHFTLLIIGLLFSTIGFGQNILFHGNQHQFVAIAHRGDHTNAPENTLAAFQNAINVEADFVEIDLRTTKDNQLIIMHNENIEHMTGKNALVSDLLFDSLIAIKIREEKHSEWGFHAIPTFREVLKLCKGKINIYLDFKAANVAETFKQILEEGMENHVVVYINEPGQLNDWETIAPDMPLMISLPKEVKTKKEMFQLLDDINIDILDGNYSEYNSETVAAAKEKNIPIWADIQSKDEGPENWKVALALGLSGLQTDHPKALIDYLVKKGKR